MISIPTTHRLAVRAGVFAIVGALACARRPAGIAAYEARRDEYRRTLTAREKRGEDVSAANDSALRVLDSLVRPVVGDFSAPWVVGPGRISLQSLLPDDVDSALPDGMIYQSRDSSIQVLVTTPELLRSWIIRPTDRDTVFSRSLRVALDNEDVLTQLFDFEAHAYSYTDIPVESPTLGIVAAKLVRHSQDYAPSPADELMIGVARGARIFIIDAPARDTLPIPPVCRARADSGRARSASLVDRAFRATPHDTALLTVASRNVDVTDSLFRRCYGEEVAREPRFQDLIAQVRGLVESLPPR